MPDRGAFPRISVVTPSFNQGPFLERTILSVLDQHYPNLEYIIIDGGSTDNSPEIIRRYEKHLAFWVSEPDRGQSHAINKGFARATGELLAWLNSDDYYLPNALHSVADAMLTTSDAQVFVGSADWLTLDGAVRRRKAPPPEITLDSLYNWMRGTDFLQPSCFFRDTAWRQAGPLDEETHITFDLDLWFRMITRGSIFKVLDVPLSVALLHPSAKTTAYSYLAHVDFAIVAMRYGGEHAARQILEDMAIRLSWAEPNLEKLLENRVFKVVERIASRFMKPAVRRRDTIPRWLKKDSTSSPSLLP